MNLNKNKDETLKEFCLRMAEEKQSDKSITWQDISDAVYSNYGEFKTVSGIKSIVRRSKLNISETDKKPDTPKDETEDKLLELKKERIKSHEKYIEDLYAINPNIIALETYKGANIPILHKCLIDNNEWSVRPAGILFGFGCPVCNESHGEKQIRTWLNAHNIQYESQYIFDDCKDKKFLPFDFYLPDLNLCVEYDGEQHFKSIDFFGGEDGLQKRQLHDKIKTEYCQNNNISLLRIKYDENIEDKLNNFIHLI